MKREIRIVIADDHPFVRRCFAKIIGKHIGITLLEEADNGDDLIEIINKTVPDLAVIDLSMPRKNGYDAISEIHTRHPQVKIIAFSGYLTPENQKRAIDLGAHATISKTVSTKILDHAIKQVLDGESYHTDVTSSESASPQDGKGSTELTKREQQIADLVLNGKSSKEISALLNISKLTVDKHRANIKQKLGAKNVAEMVVMLSLK